MRREFYTGSKYLLTLVIASEEKEIHFFFLLLCILVFNFRKYNNGKKAINSKISFRNERNKSGKVSDCSS